MKRTRVEVPSVEPSVGAGTLPELPTEIWLAIADQVRERWPVALYALKLCSHWWSAVLRHWAPVLETTHRCRACGIPRYTHCCIREPSRCYEPPDPEWNESPIVRVTTDEFEQTYRWPRGQFQLHGTLLCKVHLNNDVRVLWRNFNWHRTASASDTLWWSMADGSVYASRTDDDFSQAWRADAIKRLALVWIDSRVEAKQQQ